MSATVSCARIRNDQGYRDELRLRAQTDLFWLAHDLLGYDRISERYHRIVAQHYVQKDPRKPIGDQDTIKNRLHLDPRGTFKSTMNMADTVQWVICFVDAALLLLSASTKLTQGFLGEVTQHFVLPKGATPTPFQELFIEYTIPPSAQLVGGYTAPCRATARKEATIMASSVESSLSGWHFDVIKEDDVVDNRNSETATSIAKVKKNRHINRKMLMPWGYRDTAGTRYDPFDAYGEDIANAKPGQLKLLVRPALTLNDGSRLTPMGFPAPEDCTLVFPDLLSYEYLRADYEADYAAFQTQYMNDAHGGKDITFKPEDITAATLSEEQMPATGAAVIAWRFACSSKDGMKYAGAAVGRIDSGRTYIVDTVRGIFAPTTLARRVVELARKHYTRDVQIEDTPGARYLQRHIENAMLALNWEIHLAWSEFEDDDGARDLRMKSIEPLLSARRLYFAEDLPHMRDLVRQFGNYGMVEENELVDVIARVTESMPGSIELLQSDQGDDSAMREMIERDRYDRTYGLSHAPASHDDLAATMEPELDQWEPEAAGSRYDIAPGLGV